MAVTLLAFWQQQLAIHQAAQAAAQQELADGQQRAGAARVKLATDQKALAATGDELAAARAALAAEANPANAEPLLEAITSLIITQRGQQGTVLDDQDELADAQAAAEAAAGALARAAARAAAVQATIAAVTPDDTRRANYKTAIAAPPLDTLEADAGAFVGSATVTNATACINGNFPAELVAIAGKRRDTRMNHLAQLQANAKNAADALGTASAADAGLAGKAAQKRLAFERAQEALADYVGTAGSRFARATAVMSTLEAIELDGTGAIPDVLTDAEKEQLTEQSAAGAAAEPTAEALDGDMNAVFTAENALATQIVTSINTDVDAVSTDPQVAAKRTAVTAARTTFSNALSAFAAADKPDLDQWQATIPDRAWRVLLEYHEGMAALNELSATDPTTLAAAMDTAENDYAVALGAMTAAERRAEALADAVAYRQDLLAAGRAASAARLPSAIRGDSY